MTGCATQKNMELSDNFWQQKNQKIVVAKSKAPKPEVMQVGNQGLIDYAINTQMAKPINERLEKVDTSWYPALQRAFTQKLAAHGMQPSIYPTDLNIKKLPSSNKDINKYAATDYSTVIAPVNANTFLIIQLDSLGAIRKYSGFIPTGAPEAHCSITGELVDTKDQHLLWRYKADVTIPVQGEWDQPPAYTNLNNALQLAITTAQQEVIDNFFSGH